MFRLALRQTEGLIGSILQLLGLGLAVPDHSTLNRRAETLEVPRPRCGREPVHLLVDSTGLRLCGPGGWLDEKHGSKRAEPGRCCTSSWTPTRARRRGPPLTSDTIRLPRASRRWLIRIWLPLTGSPALLSRRVIASAWLAPA
jgi:Transposase DDE domain